MAGPNVREAIRLGAEIKSDASKICAEYANDLCDNLVFFAPFKTGRLKANFTVLTGKRNIKFLQNLNNLEDVAAAKSRQRAAKRRALKKFEIGQQMVVANPAPYAATVNQKRRYVEKAIRATK